MTLRDEIVVAGQVVTARTVQAMTGQEVLNYGMECARIALGSMPCSCEFDYSVGREPGPGPTVVKQCDRCQRLAQLDKEGDCECV